MPTDTEELILRISVVDDGSADKIKEIQEALGKFPGMAPEHAKRFKNEAKEMFETVSKGFETIEGGPAAMAKLALSIGPVVAGMGELAVVIGAAVAATVLAYKEMGEFSKKLVELGNISKQTGIEIGDVQEIIEQFDSQGIQNGAQALQGLSETMENLSHTNSSLYRSLLVSAGQFKPAMQNFLEGLATADSAEQRINRIWAAAQNVQRNTYAEMRARGWSEDAAREAATQRAARFGAELGQPNIMQMRHPLEEPTAEEKENRRARQLAAQEFYETTVKIGQAWEKMKDSVLGIITPVATEVLKGLLSAFESVARVLGTVEHAIRSAWNAIPDVLKNAIAGAARGVIGGPGGMVAGAIRGAIHGGEHGGEHGEHGGEHDRAGLTHGGHALGIPSRQHGGAITETGAYTLHAGEMVASAGQTSSAMREMAQLMRELNATMRGMTSGPKPGERGFAGSNDNKDNLLPDIGAPPTTFDPNRFKAGPQYTSMGGTMGATMGGGAGGGGGGGGFQGGGGQFGGGGASGSWGDGDTTAPQTGPQAGALSGNVKVGDIETKGNQVNPQSLYRNLVGAFRGSSLSGYVPPDGAKYGIKTGSPEEWARLATALASQESSFQVRSHETGFGGHLAGVFQFGAVDLQRRGLGTDVGNVPNQVKAMIGEFEKIKTEGSIAGGSRETGWKGAQHYFGPFRRPQEVLKHMGEAERIARGAGAVPAATRADTATPEPSGGDSHGGPSAGDHTTQPHGGTVETGQVGVTSRGEYHKAGTVTIGGESFHWGSGGHGQAIPYGTYNIDFRGVGEQGRTGWGGRLPPAVAGVTTGASGNVIQGGGYKGSGIEIHSGSSNHLDTLYSAGCFAIAPAEWPRFKAKLLEEASRAPGGKLRLAVTPGKYANAAVAAIGPSGQKLETEGTPTQGGGQIEQGTASGSQGDWGGGGAGGGGQGGGGGGGGFASPGIGLGGGGMGGPLGGIVGAVLGRLPFGGLIGQMLGMFMGGGKGGLGGMLGGLGGMGGGFGGLLGGLMGGHGGGFGGMLGGLMGGGAGGAGLGALLGGSTGQGLLGGMGSFGPGGSGLLGGLVGAAGEHARAALGAVDRAPLDRMLGSELRHRVDGHARIHVAVDDQRTSVRAPRPSGLFRDAVVQRQAQMIPASPGPAATPTHPGGMGGGGTFG